MKDSFKRQVIYSTFTAVLFVCPLLGHADVGSATRVDIIVGEGVANPEVVLQEQDKSNQKYVVTFDQKNLMPNLLYVSDIDLKDSKHFALNADGNVLIADAENPYMKKLVGLGLPVSNAAWAIRPVAGGNNLFVHDALTLSGVHADGYTYDWPSPVNEADWAAFKIKVENNLQTAPAGFYAFDDQAQVMHVNFSVLE